MTADSGAFGDADWGAAGGHAAAIPGAATQEWLTVTEVCAEFRLGRNHVYELIRSGKLSALNLAVREGIRPTYRIHRSDIDALRTSPPPAMPSPSPIRRRAVSSSTRPSILRRVERDLREERAA